MLQVIIQHNVLLTLIIVLISSPLSWVEGFCCYKSNSMLILGDIRFDMGVLGECWRSREADVDRVYNFTNAHVRPDSKRIRVLIK
jgi:hypothetical protein